MPALYDLPTLLNQNTEGINFSAHLRFIAMSFQVAVNTFVLRSRLREVRTMPSVGCELFAVAIYQHPIVLRSPAVHFDSIERTHPCRDGIYRRKLARTLRQDYSFERLEREEEKEADLNYRETNGEIGTDARLAANLDSSSMGADNGFDYAQAETETRL